MILVCIYACCDPHVAPHACRSCEEPRKVANRVTVHDMVTFFLDYIKNDQVGRICNFHLAIADASPVYANEHRR